MSTKMLLRFLALISVAVILSGCSEPEVEATSVEPQAEDSSDEPAFDIWEGATVNG